jgi:hypothetical protein
MPFPTDHLEPQFMPSRADANRLWDMINLMSQPTPGGSCKVPLPSSTRVLNTSGLPTAREALVMPPGITANSAIARAGASLIQLSPVHNEIQLSSPDLSKIAGWTTPADVSPATPSQVAKPKYLSAYINVSSALWKTAPILAAALMEAQLHAAIGAAIDKAALVGTGTGQPLGLIANTNVPSTVSAITLAAIATKEKTIGEAYCETSPLGLIVSPSARNTMRTTYENGAGSASVWNALADMNRQTTPHCPASTVVIGDFSQMFVAMWGDINIQTNPYTAASGMIRVMIEVNADIQILRSGAFGVIKPA